MAANEETADCSSADCLNNLSEMFDKATKIVEELDITNHPSNSAEYQHMVNTGIKLLEDATHMVNDICMFSSNESIEEVSTSDLKFMLLPALLGCLSLKLKYTSPENRLEKLKLSELYYRDFLKRCKAYEVSDIKIPDMDEGTENGSDDTSNKKNSPADLNQMAAKRNAVIDRFKQTKEMQQRLSDLKKVLDEDEAKREYYLLLLKKWIFTSLEELNSIKMEKMVLARMIKAPRSTRTEEKKKPQPLKPIIIVKNELQKKVFGLGYPSAPMMTVDEFYKQRYPEGDNSEASNPGKSLQQMAYDPEASKKREEAEDIEQEENIEKDDPITLQKIRAFDDWKDENRRGSGNRKNRG